MFKYSAITAEEPGDRPPSSSSSAASKRSHRGKRDVGYVGQASWISSVINLLNTIIGAGVLAMPLAVSHMGIVLGGFVIVWAGLTSALGLYFQTRCARYLERGTSSFFALSQLTYPNAAVVFDAAIAIKCFGVAVSYLIIIGDLMPGVVEAYLDRPDHFAFWTDRNFWVTAFMFFIIPLCFLRRLDSLKYTSFIALVSIGYLVVLVVAHFIQGDVAHHRHPIHRLGWAGLLPTLSSFPVVVFSYTCHQNMFPVLNELKDNSSVRTTGVVAASIGSACFIYLLVAMTGYLTFGDDVTGNIVSMYPPSAASTICRAAIVVFFMLSYPLQVHPCRSSIDTVLRWRPKSSNSLSSSPPSSSSADSSPSRAILLPSPSSSMAVSTSSSKRETMSDIRFAIITTVIIVFSYAVAMTVSSLERVLAYVGSTGSTSISFILPGLFYYKISDPRSMLHQKRLRVDDDDDDDYDHNPNNGFDVEGNHHHRAMSHDRATKKKKSSSLWSTWKKKKLKMKREHREFLIRQSSLALAVYGIVVMIVCLLTHTIFLEFGH